MSSDKSSDLEILRVMDEEIVTLMENALEVLENLGYELIYIDDFYNSYYANMTAASMNGKALCHNFNDYIIGTSSSIKNFTDLYNSHGYIQDLSDYYYYCDISFTNYIKKSISLNDTFRACVYSVMEENDIDVFVYPTMKSKVITMEEVYHDGYAVGNSIALSPPLGFPSLEVQIGFDSEGIPYGMELLADKNHELLLYQIGSDYENATNYYKNPSDAPNLYEVTEKVAVPDIEEEPNDNMKVYTPTPNYILTSSMIIVSITFSIILIFHMKKYV